MTEQRGILARGGDRDYGGGGGGGGERERQTERKNFIKELSTTEGLGLRLPMDSASTHYGLLDRVVAYGGVLEEERPLGPFFESPVA
jgi:hypothetical protein